MWSKYGNSALRKWNSAFSKMGILFSENRNFALKNAKFCTQNCNGDLDTPKFSVQEMAILCSKKRLCSILPVPWKVIFLQFLLPNQTILYWCAEVYKFTSLNSGTVKSVSVYPVCSLIQKIFTFSLNPTMPIILLHSVSKYILTQVIDDLFTLK